jgi:hypothetical protein
MNGKLANEQISKLANVHPDNYREGRLTNLPWRHAIPLLRGVRKALSAGRGRIQEIKKASQPPPLIPPQAGDTGRL